MVSTQSIRDKVLEKLPGARVEVKDLTGTNDHFELTVVSPEFTGKPLMARHRLIYGILGNWVGVEIHALTLKAFTPDESKGEPQ